MPKKSKTQCAAVVTVRDAKRWSKRGRREVAAWIRKQADMIEQYSEAYEGTCRMRYLY